MIHKLQFNQNIKQATYFLLMLGLLFAIWKISFHFIWSNHNLLLNYRQIALGLIHVLVSGAYQLVTLIGYDANYIIEERLLRIGYSGGVTVGEPCSGIDLAAIYIGLILAFPGNSKTKIIYLILGTLLIFIINTLRIAALAIISFEEPHLLNFNHDFTFQAIVLGVIFLLWVSFTKKTSGNHEFKK